MALYLRWWKGQRDQSQSNIFCAIDRRVCIASPTRLLMDWVYDKQGPILGFAVWLTIGDGILTFLIALIWKRRDMVADCEKQCPDWLRWWGYAGWSLLDHHLCFSCSTHGHGLWPPRDKCSFCGAHFDFFVEGRIWGLALRVGWPCYLWTNPRSNP